MVVERDEDGWLVGSIVELPGCVTQARSLPELRKRMLEAATLYLAEAPKDSFPKFVGVKKLEVPA